jgi:glycosyltransferase involved in cell wall biosynthesis
MPRGRTEIIQVEQEFGSCSWTVSERAVWRVARELRDSSWRRQDYYRAEFTLTETDPPRRMLMSESNAIEMESPSQLLSERRARVSTIIPAFNAERTIAQTIDSALAQRFDGHEIVVVNDGSTDSTAAILKKYSNRIRVVTRPNRGAAAARNTGVAHSTGDYIAILDSDDLWLAGKLHTMVATLERNRCASLAFSEYAKIDEHGVEFAESAIGHAPSMNEMMSSLPPILTSTLVIRRRMFDLAGGFHEEFKGQGFEDLWLLLLLRELGEFEYVPDKLTGYRVSNGDESADKYSRGAPTFITLVKRRYRSRGKDLIRTAKNLQCRWLLSKAAHQMDRQDRLRALISLTHILWIRPAYFFGSEFADRLLLPQNVKRIRDLTIVRSSEARG